MFFKENKKSFDYLAEIGQSFSFLLESNFAIKKFDDYFEYTKGDLAIQVHFSKNHRDNCYIYVVINSKNIFESDILNEIEKAKYLQEYKLLYSQNIEQSIFFYSSLIKTKMDLF